MSDDNKESKRPNAKYKLSHEKIQGPEIVHHYNRERRLDKSSQAVRDLYTEQPRRRFGFLHSLTGSKSNTMLFGTILILCAFMLALSYFGLTGDSRELEGNILSVQGKNYDGTVLIEVKKTLGKNKFARSIKAYTGAVNIAVFPPSKTGQEQSQPADVFFHKIFFTNEREEHYSFSVPFRQSELALIFQTEQKTINMTIHINNK